jgi:XTP/dITP diphosphohydrolase
MEIIFATNNDHKVQEMQAAVGNQISLISLTQADIHIDIPEPHDTLEANASEKSKTIHRLSRRNCFSEDTGLEVDALNGEPGVHSARYAGEGSSGDQNITKLLSKLKSSSNRRAKFRTVISLLISEKEYFFEGECLGRIAEQKRGDAGFGYDPVFIPEGSTRTFAEMTTGEKNVFSHRKKAADKLVEFLKTKHLT